MQTKLKVMAAAALLAFASASQAVIFTYTGNTTGGPTFNRPLEDLSGLSAIGSSVRYSAFTFSVATSGDYSFVTTGEFDTFVILYANAFNPAAPLINAIAANDDLLAPPFTTSGLIGTLTAGGRYVLVTTGYQATDFGAFSTTIGGPGAITPVPEPSVYLVLALGLGVVGWAKGRQT